MPAQDTKCLSPRSQAKYQHIPNERGPNAKIYLVPLSKIPIKIRSKKQDLQVQDLSKLLTLVNTPASKQEVPGEQTEAAGKTPNKTLQWPSQQPCRQDAKHQITEAMALEQFSMSYQTERNFSHHQHHKVFTHIFTALVKERLLSREWTESAPPENILRVLVCLRILMRDTSYQSTFSDLGGVKVLAMHLQKATDSYLTYGDGPFVVDILKEMTNIFQKLSVAVSYRESLVKYGVHKALVLLLSANDVVVLHCTLHALISLATSPEPCSKIAELNSIEVLLRILQEYDTLSKKLAANLLRLLCSDCQAKEMVKVFDGIPLLLSLLHSDSPKLLVNVVWCLVQLSSDKETSDDIRMMGGIPLLLSLLHDRKFVSERAAASGMASASIQTPEEEMWEWPEISVTADSESTQNVEMREHQMSLKSACCACLTELVLNDTNAQQIVQANGIYSIGLLMLPRDTTRWQHRELVILNNLQANAFRALRFLFSMERNRRLFKRLFPPDLFEMFIDIGHYNRNIKAYGPLVEKINSLDEDILDEIRENLESSDQSKEPSKYIGDYAVLELLGSGAFGSVYKVKKKTAGQSYLAMKEINTLNPSWGKSSKERQKSVGDVISELTIIREQLKHPNVVRYYKTFVDTDKLYIVMELIEGAPIGEHFTSLKEKKEHFSEDRIWHIFIQMVLALRYLHKEKGIVHRDLTPNNIMLGENDKVTITDFGLAKQKQKDCSKMTSVVGTILYSCPEIVQSQPYGEKADVWAVGCILYQMCTLNPPFYSNNMLSLATKIVQAEYEQVPESLGYSEQVLSTIRKCIDADPSTRPDIIGVAAHIADRILLHLDQTHREQLHLEKKLEREQRRTQKHYYEAHKNMQNYHRLFLVSQERYDKLVNLASSGGASSIKDEADIGESVFSDTDNPTKSTTVIANGNTDSEGDDSTLRPQNGWGSDDDHCSSGSEGQGSLTASRESSSSSAARVRGVPPQVPRPPEGNPRGRRGKRGQGITMEMNNNQLSHQLTLDIPTKYSRDSGISSGDPSPNTPNTSPPSSGLASGGSTSSGEGTPLARPRSYPGGQRSGVSTGALELLRKTSAGARTRPNSATPATLTISPRKVREINDPISQMLHQLHKIIYITQLPPTLCHNPKRKVIERFKRTLFAPQSTSFNLKNELKKLLTGSREVVDMHFGSSDSQKLARQVSQEQSEALAANTDKAQVFDTEAGGEMITYEQMQTIIESVLLESGYYDMSPQARNKTFPFSPLGPVDLYAMQNAFKSA